MLSPTPCPTPSGAPTLKQIEQTLANKLCALLNLQQLDRNKAFREIGLGTQAREQFLQTIHDTYGLRITALRLFDYPNITDLSAYIFATLSSHSSEINNIEKEPHHPPLDFDVAVIGLSCRFPGATNAEQFWHNLKEGVHAIGEIGRERWADYDWFDADPAHEGTSYNRWGGFIDDADRFDPLFFGISPVEAVSMDPQQRVFLEECWKAIEDAGHAPGELSRQKVGVFVGADAGDYLQLLQERGGGLAGAVFTGTSQAILAGRISYFLNLTGPALAIDTACSSSLVAIDRACQSLRLGESDLVLAGGVYLMNTPTDHIWASRVGMLSKGDRCRTFDEHADGITLGEGVGVVVLKRREAAERDGDRIYAVIKGSGINQDGRTNGITAPSARSQNELESGVYGRCGIDPSTISYIEAHGTGTRLGDPIEVNALIESFGAYTDRKSYCAIGSVKSNIGHTAFAAGIAGFLKVVLMLEHGQYVPSLHYNKSNKEIDFESSPFYVNTACRAWPTEDNAPRRAAVSSFGFSGTNAHVVLEEYRAKPEREERNGGHVVLLSARTKERVKEQAKNLKEYMERHEDVNLTELAYTLQVGRDAMEERLAFVANDINEAASLLAHYLTGDSSRIYTGNIKRERAVDDEPAVEKALTAQDAETLAQLWAAGADVNWKRLYGAQKPRRIGLPAYPFARERYWIEKSGNEITAGTQLHPLVHRNESDMGEQKYASRFSGRETFFTHHQVQGRKILPGVAYLEMAQAAGTLALRERINRLRDITWLTPIEATGPKEVSIRLLPAKDGVSYEVYTEDGDERIHGQGLAASVELPAAPKSDLAAIKARLSTRMEGASYYALFEQMGLHYGSSFQGIKEIYYGRGEALSRIAVAPQDGFTLPPGLMDSALQTTVGLGLSQGTPPLCLPYSVHEVSIFADLPTTLWCYVRLSASHLANSSFTTYDIDLLDDEGACLVQLKELVALPLEGAEIKEKAKEQNDVLYIPLWERVTAASAAPLPAGGRQLLITGGDRSALADALIRQLQPYVEIREELNEAPAGLTDVYLLQGLLPDSSDDPAEDCRRRELPVFRAIKALLDAGYSGQRLNITAFSRNTQKALPSDAVQAAGSGIAGLIGSLAKEETSWQMRMIDLDDTGLTNDYLQKILSTPYDGEGTVTCYRRGLRYERSLYPASLPERSPAGLRRGGTYVLLGGAGGIGQATSAHLVRSYGAQVIWLGRSAPDERIARKQEEIKTLGSRPLYIQCDANDHASMEGAYRQIKSAGYEVNGLFHSAIVLHDRLLKHMSEEDFRRAFEPKALGSHHLVECFRNEPLDFICFYSSVQAQWTMAGQANYAAGCTYKDSYAHSLQSRNLPARIINWGYWGEVGVVSGSGYRQRMASIGVDSMTEAEGMDILDRLLSNNHTQTIAIKLIHDQQD